MKLVQLQILVALKKCGSFSKAAEHLYTSQPAISVALRALEEELGHPICVRTNRGSSFTPFGEKVLEQAEIAVSAANQIYHISYQDDTAFCGALTVASLPHLCNLLLLDLQADMIRAHPKLSIQIESRESNDILSCLEQSKLDLGLIQMCDIDEAKFHRQLHQKRLHYIPLFRDRVFFVCLEGHPLSQTPHATLEELFQYPYVTHCRQINRYADSLFHQFGYQQQIVEINEFVRLRKYAKNHNAISFLPEMAIQHGNMNYQDKFCPIFVDGLDWTTEVGLVSRHQSLNEVEQLFLDQLKEACRTVGICILKK